jgi:hypothetical protein
MVAKSQRSEVRNQSLSKNKRLGSEEAINLKAQRLTGFWEQDSA